MRILLVLFISIVFIAFVLCSIALNTTWLNSTLNINTEEVSTLITLRNIQIATMLLLSSFLIAHARYCINLERQSKKRVFQLYIGIFFGAIIIGKLLTSYYKMSYAQELLWQLTFTNDIKAENTILDASRMYELHGVSIEYYDFNKSKKQFEPTPSDIAIKEQVDLIREEMYTVPLYLVLAFSTMIFAHYFGAVLANREIKRYPNTKEDITK